MRLEPTDIDGMFHWPPSENHNLANVVGGFADLSSMPSLRKTRQQTLRWAFTRWNRSVPTKAALRNRNALKNDPVSSERADTQHFQLEKAIADLCSANGVRPLTSRHIDVLARVGSVCTVFEMKSCGPTDVADPLRRGLYQLLEYRYLYRNKLGPDVRLCIVIERRPRGGFEWLMGYLEHLQIGIIWRNDGDDGFSCSDFTKMLLGDTLPQVAEWDTKPILWK